MLADRMGFRGLGSDIDSAPVARLVVDTRNCPAKAGLANDRTVKA
ncbi:hypothetical protein [Microvirga sp. TS319]